MNYCTHCGGKLVNKVANAVWQCEKCHKHTYLNPIPAVDAMLMDEQGRILLGVRKNEPAIGKLNLPGGFVDPKETLEEALERELFEELGLKPSDYGKLTYLSSRMEIYPSEGTTRDLVCIIFAAKINHQNFPLGEEVSGYVWKLPAELKAGELSTEREFVHILEAAKIYNESLLASDK